MFLITVYNVYQQPTSTMNGIIW